MINTPKIYGRQAGCHFMKGFASVFPEREWTREECLAKGMSEKEYAIQKALGALPTLISRKTTCNIGGDDIVDRINKMKELTNE